MLEFILFKKNKEIFESLPEEYAKFILNAIIARAIQKGDLQDELELYLNQNEVADILSDNQIKVKQKRTVKRGDERGDKNLFSDKIGSKNIKDKTDSKASSVFTL